MGLAFRSGAAGAAILGALLMTGCYPPGAHCVNYAAQEPKMRAMCAASLHFEGRVYLAASVDIRVEGRPMGRVARIPPCYDHGRPCTETDPSDYPTQQISRIPGIDSDKAFISPSADRRTIYINDRLSEKQVKDVYDRAVEAIEEAK